MENIPGPGEGKTTRGIARAYKLFTMSFFVRRRRGHKLRGILILGALCMWLQMMGQGMSSSQAEASEEKFVQDFVEYWGAARLLVTGNNPYSPEQLLTLQRSVVSNKKQPLLMYNPPWTLFFLLPFGFLSVSTGWALWLMVNVSCLLLSAAQLWRLYGGASSQYRLAWLVCFSVFPTYLILYVSQITPLVLLGITGFLQFHARKQWWLAGLMLSLVGIKPHLVSLFWIALVVTALTDRRWQLIASGAIAGAVTSLVPLLFAPSIFHDYIKLLSELKPASRWATPTLGRALSVFLGLDNPWLAYLPLLCGVVWYALYWRKYRVGWNWTNQMPLLLLVSQATSVFAWTFDQVILLPALIEATVWSIRGGRTRIIVFGWTVFALVNLPQLLRFNYVLFLNEFSLFWMVPVYLFAYCVFRSKINQI